MPHKGTKLYTPDGRYFVIRGRLWRLTNPLLDDMTRERLVLTLMAARRAVAAAKRAGDRTGEDAAHASVDRAKRGLGERGPVWWHDGSPDYNRHLARNTPYAAWYAAVHGTGAETGADGDAEAHDESQPAVRSKIAKAERSR